MEAVVAVVVVFVVVALMVGPSSYHWGESRWFDVETCFVVGRFAAVAVVVVEEHIAPLPFPTGLYLLGVALHLGVGVLSLVDLAEHSVALAEKREEE